MNTLASWNSRKEVGANLSVALITTAVLILLQVAAYCLAYPDIFIRGKVFSSINVEELLFSRFTLDLLQFLFVLLAIHLVFSYSAIQMLFKIIPQKVSLKTWHIVSFVLIVFWLVVLATGTLFPHSIFQSGIIPNKNIAIALLVIIAISIFVSNPRLFGILIVILSMPILLSNLVLSSPIHKSKTTSVSKPNIIILSIDSLRPDQVNIQNPELSTIPNISRRIAQSIWYPNTYTPLARTFPSWMSLLTGLSPKEHGAEFNLTDPERFKFKRTLPQQLQLTGYRTYFATDERRFANITKTMGFDEVFGPNYGVADFLLGKFGDWPLLNLFTLVPKSERWLPFISLNRGAEVTYMPDRFTNYLNEKFKNLSSTPVFIAIHLCLPHHPFTWRNSTHNDTQPDAYFASLKAADDQAEAIVLSLIANKLLTDNDILVLMSDHGEALPTDSTSFTNSSNADDILTIDSIGHGTDPRQLVQHNVLLSLQLPENKPNIETQLSSLTDVSRSLLAYLSLPAEDFITNDNQDLFNADNHLQSRWLTFENGYNVPAMTISLPNEMESAAQGITTYRVTKAGKVVIRSDKYNELLHSKLYTHWNGQLLTFYETDSHSWLELDWATKKFDQNIEGAQNLVNH